MCIAFASFAQLPTSRAQTPLDVELKPDTRRALVVRPTASTKASARTSTRHQTTRNIESLPARPQNLSLRTPARPPKVTADEPEANQLRGNNSNDGILPANVAPGTSLRRVLHTAQLSLTSSAGTNEQYVDRNGDLRADDRTTFDRAGGSFDIAVGSSGARYEVYSATNDRGTSTTTDDIPVGVLRVAFDTNGDFQADSSTTYDLERDFRLPSSASVVSGTSRAGREFVIVSSSGYYNFDDPRDPNNESSAGVVLLVRDTLTNGFDNTRSRELVRVGSNQLNNANALALLPNNDLLIADFESNELRIVRDTNSDGIPDTLDSRAYYQFRYSNDAPLDIAANSRGVVFSHSYGNDAVLLAIYDANADGFADTDEVTVEGLSLDNNLALHGLTVDREGNVYVIEDASGAADLQTLGGNLGAPRVSAFPDPALNGFLRDGAIFARADNANAQALTGLAFGRDASVAPVGTLTVTNSASQRGNATYDGLATITGSNLTLGARGSTEAASNAASLRVTVEGVRATVLSFDNTRINIYVPAAVGARVASVVVSVNDFVTAAEDARIMNANPGVFTRDASGNSNNGGGEAVALLVSGNRYTASPFPARFNNQPSVIAIFGTGWRNSLPVQVTIGGRACVVEYAGAAGGFAGLDQINVRLPDNIASGQQIVIVTTANNVVSRNDVYVTIR